MASNVSKLKKFLEIEWIKYRTKNRKIKDINNCFRKNNCFFFFLVVYYDIKLCFRISAQFFSFNISMLSIFQFYTLQSYLFKTQNYNQIFVFS